VNHQFTPLSYANKDQIAETSKFTRQTATFETFAAQAASHKPRSTQQPPSMKAKVMNVTYLQHQLDNDMIRRNY